MVRHCSALCCLALTVLATATLGCARQRTEKPYLEVPIRSSVDSVVRLFVDTGRGFDEQSSISSNITRSDAFHRLRFALPRAAIERLRIDPLAGPGTADLRDMTVIEAGRTVATFPSSSLWPLNDIAAVERHGDYTRFVTPPTGADAVLMMPVGCLPRNSRWLTSHVSPASLAAVAIVLLMIAGAAGLAVVRACRPDRPESRALWLWGVSVFLLVLGAKLWLIRDYGSSVPFLDQWNAEAGSLYVPFTDGCLTWREMFQFHNEHRIFFTRVTNLGLLLLNGQWDATLQTVVNAAVHATVAALTLLTVWRATGGDIGLIAVAVGVAFGLPFSWENTLAGFQSQFYFLVLFTVLALWLMLTQRALSWAWLLGWLCSLLALVTMAGGVLTGPAIVLGRVIKLWRERRGWKDAVVTVVAAGTTTALGWAVMSEPLAQHDALLAKTRADFLTALGRNLAWPFTDTPLMAVLVWLPLIVYSLETLITRRSTERRHEFIFALAAWVLLQAGALSYARGAGGGAPASRYMDLLALGMIVNVAGSICLISAADTRVARALFVVATIAWCGMEIVGQDRLWPEALAGARGRKVWHATYERSLLAFVQTDDLAAFVSKQTLTEVPFWSAPMLANAWLRHPAIRRILPPSVRPALSVVPESNPGAAFARNGYYPWTPTDPLKSVFGSFSERGNGAVGRLVSGPLACSQGKELVFEVAGYLGESGLSLVLEEGPVHRPVVPPRIARESWIPVVTTCPSGPFRILAVDENPSSWFAFREPVEAGSLSTLAEWLIARCRWLLLAGTLAAAFALRNSQAANGKLDRSSCPSALDELRTLS